jgi:two-component system, response regulator PdtaR
MVQNSGSRSPVASVDEALEISQRERPDAAILDLNLRGQAATPVARQFRELALPFVIASAYSNTDLPRDDSLRGIANVGKPTNIATLIQILHRITDF